MGAIIEAVCTSRARGVRSRGSVRLAVDAAAEALRVAGCPPEEIDVLINTGICRDENICEPAMAPFVQKGIGANPGLPGAGRSTTFSFDLANGGCGFLNACQVADGLLGSCSARHVIVVSGDVDPTPGGSEHFPFVPMGGAVLLGPGGPDRGFLHFDFETFPKHADLFGLALMYVERPGRRRLRSRPKHPLVVHQDDRFLDECAECAGVALERFLARRKLGPEALDLLICSSYPDGLPRALAERAGVPSDRVVLAETRGAVHTAAIPMALEAALGSGRFQTARNVVIVAVASGIDVGVALYRNPSEAA